MMGSMEEEKIQKLAQFTDKNPGVDVTPLLQEQLKPTPNRWRVYLISALFPPFGLLYTVRYLFVENDTDEKRQLGWTSLAITVAMLILMYASFSSLAQTLFRFQPGLEQNPADLLRQYQEVVQ